MSEDYEKEDYQDEINFDVQIWKDLNTQIYSYISNKKSKFTKLMKNLKKANEQIDKKSQEIQQLKDQIKELNQKKQSSEIKNQQLIQNNVNLELYNEYQNEILALKALEDEIYDMQTPRMACSELNFPQSPLKESAGSFEIASPTMNRYSKLWHFSTVHKQNRIILENNNKRAQFPPDESLVILDKQIRPYEVFSIRFKMIDGFGFDIGICNLQKEFNVLLRDVGLCFYNGGNPAYLYENGKVAKRYGQESYRQGLIEMHIDAKKGTIGYSVNGQNYGEAFNGLDFMKNVYYPAVSSQFNRIIEIVDSMQQTTYDFSL